MKTLRLLLFATAALSALPAVAATLTLNPIADSFVDSAHPDNNYGVAGALAVAPAGAPKGEFDSFLKFDLSGVVGLTIQSISLQLNAASPNNGIFNGNLAGPGGTNVNSAGGLDVTWLQNDSWVEGTGTPNATDMNPADLNFTNHSNYFSAGDAGLGAFAFSGATTGAAVYTLTLAPSFLADAQAGNVVSLYLSAADTQIVALFNSKNDSSPGSRPVLEVVTVPEPGSLAFAALGAAIFAGMKRRK